MRKLGIAAKLYLAFGGIFLLAVVASSAGWKGFQRVADSQNSVIDQAIPGLRSAHQLSTLNAGISASAQQLARVDSESERKVISSALFARVERMKKLIDESEQKGFSLESLQPLRETIREIETRLHLQDNLVSQRIDQQIHFAQLVARLSAATEELNDLADSLVANAAATSTAITSSLYDLVEKDANKRQLYDVFDRLVEVDLDAMERMYELRLRSANLNALINRVAKEPDLEELDELKQRSTETISILKRRVSEINDPQRRHKAGELLSAMEVDNGPLYAYGIFEIRVSLLQIEEALNRLSIEIGQSTQALNFIIGELNQTGGELINKVSTTAKQSLDFSQRLFGSISFVLLIVAAGILWWFIKRNVVRRLLSLQSATRSITRGNYDVDIVIEGHDELTDMGVALRGFRNNAIENRKLDEELHRHKDHLEELVEERSEQLRRTNQMLSEEVRNHALARDKAEQASQAKTAFLATMSHELRTPLSGALGTLRLLSNTSLEKQQSEYVDIIQGANTTLLDIVNDILGYSQIEAGRLNIENRPFDLRKLIDDVIGLMNVSVSEKGNHLSLDLEPGEPLLLMGDSGKLHQILINLIGNANKFTHKGSITLAVKYDIDQSARQANLQFCVTDDGIGIAEDRQEEIFHAFTQVDTSSSRQYGGIGLGLAICDRLVKAMGGSISLTSKPGKGTRVSFDLDIVLCEFLSAVEVQNPQTEAAHVLMVEDDAVNSMVTSHYLESLGHQVTAAHSGEQAIELLEKNSYSLLLLDISLPGIDGLAILRHLRTCSDPSVADLPVIAMSAHVFKEEVDEYLNAGMNGFLGKPFTIEELQQVIATTMRGHESVVNPDIKTIKTDELKQFDPVSINDDIARLGLDKVEGIVKLYLQTSQELIAELRTAIKGNENDGIKKRAHTLKGAAGNFGMEVLYSVLSRIETLAGEKQTVSEELIEQLDREYEDAITFLVDHLSEQKKVFRDQFAVMQG